MQSDISNYMENNNSERIFKKNAKFEVKVIDFSDKKTIEKIKEVNKKQEEILRRKIVDADKLNVVVQL